MRRLLPSGIVLLAALALAGCTSAGSADPHGSGSGGAANSSSTTAAPSPTAAGSAPALPAVANATNLQVEPIPSAGTPPAPTLLVSQDLVVGTGTTAPASSTVEVQYVGANYADGKVFDSSWSRGQPATFGLNQVIPGFAEGIV